VVTDRCLVLEVRDGRCNSGRDVDVRSSPSLGRCAATGEHQRQSDALALVREAQAELNAVNSDKSKSQAMLDQVRLPLE
jgi:hypothetical protein